MFGKKSTTDCIGSAVVSAFPNRKVPLQLGSIFFYFPVKLNDRPIKAALSDYEEVERIKSQSYISRPDIELGQMGLFN